MSTRKRKRKHKSKGLFRDGDGGWLLTLAQESLDGHGERLDLDDLPWLKGALVLCAVQLLRCIGYRMCIHVHRPNVDQGPKVVTFKLLAASWLRPDC